MTFSYNETTIPLTLPEIFAHGLPAFYTWIRAQARKADPVIFQEGHLAANPVACYFNAQIYELMYIRYEFTRSFERTTDAAQVIERMLRILDNRPTNRPGEFFRGCRAINSYVSRRLQAIIEGKVSDATIRFTDVSYQRRPPPRHQALA